jgi:excisionase family DNA binding protein
MRCFKNEVKEMPDFKLYTIDEIAEILKVTQRTIYNYIKSGSLKAIKIGKYWRVKQSDLEQFLEFGTNL